MRAASLLGLLLFLRSSSLAQFIDARHMGEPIDLNGTWLYHAGDDSRWKNPDLADADWKRQSSNIDWYARGSQWKGYFWYRIHVHLPPQHASLKLLANYMGNPYEVFANGVRVGTLGSFPPNLKLIRPLVRMFPIPASAIPGDSMVIAIRYWAPPLFQGGWGGLRQQRAVVLGPAGAIDKEYDSIQSQLFYNWAPDICVRFVSVLLACGLLILYWWQKQFPEYVWIACYFFAMTIWTVLSDYQSVAPISLEARNYCDLGPTVVAEALLLEFVFAFLKRPMPVWLRVYQVSLFFQIILIVAVFAGWGSESVLNIIILLWTVPYAFVLPGVLLWRFLRGLREAGLLLVPIFLINFNDMVNSVGFLLFIMHWRKTATDMIAPFHLGPVPVYVGQIEGLLFVVSVGALLLHRFHRINQLQARAQSELEAARSMQEVMVPKRIHSAAGFAIESAYIPAQEVGGDFFQLFPGPSGSLLVIIGDVSGKGVKAAMLVSMILGLLRRTVEYTSSPAEILRDINRLLIGHTDDKFATCCCVLMSGDGSVVAANAGHLSPYCDGMEIDLPGGLPLGVSPDAEYDEVEFDVPPGKRWVFLSDGVVEARNKTGELYGFERTRTISIQTVSKIAETAQQFGQEDDITVLCIERQVVAFA